MRCAEREGLPIKRLTADAVVRLQAHSWPGNVRELENLMRRLAALAPDETVPATAVEHELSSDAPHQAHDTHNSLGNLIEHHLDGYFASHGVNLPPDGVYSRVMKEIEGPLIARSLQATRGNQIRTASLLGLNRNTLRKKIRELEIEVVRAPK